MRIIGHYETLGNTQYFIPDPLPPKNPLLQLDAEALALYGDTLLELGKLNELSRRVPNRERFIKAYIIKEALLSSAIEGIHTTLVDVYTQPLLETKPSKETQLVLNYTKALSIALTMICKEELPISSRVILASHKALMSLGDGLKADPGNYRKLAVRVGNLIPPPPAAIPELMAQLEKYINEENGEPLLIKAGLAHVQFEEIHPFLDGNGRIGRLLIVLMLIDKGILSEPLLYPSYYFKKHHLEYYQRLDRVRTHGDFEGWIKYYLKGMLNSAIDAYRRAKDIEKLSEDLSLCIINEKRFGPKMRESRLQAFSILFNYPITSINELSLQLAVSYNTASQIISDFILLGILTKETQQKRSKLFRFKAYLDLLECNYPN